MGDAKSGKTSLAYDLLGIRMSDETKETTALEYIKGTKTDKGQKVNINVYELGGGRHYEDLLEAALVSPGNADSTVVCIVVDLTNPDSIIENLKNWMYKIREETEKAMDAMNRGNNSDKIR